MHPDELQLQRRSRIGKAFIGSLKASRIKCGESKELKHTVNLSFRLQGWEGLSHCLERTCVSALIQMQLHWPSATTTSGSEEAQNAPRSAGKDLINLCFFIAFGGWRKGKKSVQCLQPSAVSALE